MTTNETAIPPRPKRIDFSSREEYQRAYGRWRDKYDPKRIAKRNERSRAYYDKHREAQLADKRVYYQENRERLDEINRQYRKQRYGDDADFRSKERERSKEHMRAYRIASPEKVKESSVRYSENHKDEIAVRNKEWRERTGYDTGPARAAYRKANRAKIAMRQRGRRQAQPPWLTKEQLAQMNEVYRLAEELTKATGIAHVVDHIWPIKGRKSCGLHVPWNLRVITQRENGRKGNREPTE
jgi:5-methylcytosine-specific restriction endonuclease McrA